MLSRRIQYLLYAASLILLVALAYSSGLYASYQFDDYIHIANNPNLADWENWRTYIQISRGAAYLSFMLNQFIAQDVPAVFRVVNIVIHMLAGATVFGISFSLLGRGLKPRINEHHRTLLSFTAAALFLLHPIQTQAVTYIIQRMASQAALLYLLAVFVFIRFRIWWQTAAVQSVLRKKLYAAATAIVLMLLYVLAFYTKESAATLPLALLLIEVSFFTDIRVIVADKQYIRRSIKKLAPVMLLAALFILWTYHSRFGFTANYLFVKQLTPDGELLTAERFFFTQMKVLPIYARLLILPMNQSIDYYIPLIYTLLNPWVLITGTVLIVLLVGSARMIYLRKHTFFAFGVLFMAVALLVEASIFPIADVLVEHRLYLPMAGFSMLVPLALYRAFRSRYRLLHVVVIVALIGSYTFLTYQRNAQWMSPRTLWASAVRTDPKNPRAHYNLGLEYYKDGQTDLAFAHYTRAIELRPSYSRAHNNLGIILLGLRQYEYAAYHFARAVETAPHQEVYQRNLEKTLEQKAQWESTQSAEQSDG